MRYIRMNKGIIEFDDNFHIIKNNELYSLFFINDIPVSEKIGDIIKQADTIEELCDEFVYIENGKLPHIFIPRGQWTYEECKKHCLDKLWHKDTPILYGAIWTDKGLIFVAKMNEDGNLELI